MILPMRSKHLVSGDFIECYVDVDLRPSDLHKVDYRLSELILTLHSYNMEEKEFKGVLDNVVDIQFLMPDLSHLRKCLFSNFGSQDDIVCSKEVYRMGLLTTATNWNSHILANAGFEDIAYRYVTLYNSLRDEVFNNYSDEDVSDYIRITD